MRVRIDSSTRSDADPHLNRHIHFQQKAKATVVTIGRQWMTKIRPSGFPCRNYVHQTGEISGVLGEHVDALGTVEGPVKTDGQRQNDRESGEGRRAGADGALIV